jgi:hypothetical protein
MQSSRELLR